MADHVARAVEVPPKIGRHVVLGYLADGGMAEIFLGKEPGGRAVVIKRILPHLARQPSFVSMFVDEARIGSLVHHRNVVEIYELGQVGHDLFLVMEYLAGESLSGLLRRLVGRKQRLPFELGAYIVAEACAGLHAAHELCDEDGRPLGLVHRDISPQNVFITYDGHVKVLDFGIATAAHRLTRTATGQVKGKFSYMSPEQCRGEPLDPRSDIFSLGVLLYELTTQRRLFKRTNELMVLKAVTEQPIRRPSREVADYPPALESTCMKALARDKHDRHATARILREELLSITGTGDRQPELAAWMASLFAERIVEKQQMLTMVRAGTDLGVLPAAEVDESIEVPPIEEPSTTAAPSTPRPEAPKRGGAVLVMLLLLLGGVGAGGWYLWKQHAAGTTPVRAVTPPPAIDARTEVTLHVDTVPSGSVVTIDGEPRGVTPIEVSLAIGDHVVTVETTGFERVEQNLALDADQRLLVPLVAIAQTELVPPPPPPKPAKPTKSKKPTKQTDPFKRYD